MPLELIERECRDAFAIVTTQWRYGDLKDLPKLRAILEVRSRHPSPASIDYDHCRVKGIRVLSCAPAFGPMVAEMAHGMTIDAVREITAGHEALRAGEDKYLWHGNENTFTLYGGTVGLIGFGGLAQCLKPLLAPFGCRLIAHDPWRTDQYLKDQGTEPVGLDDLLSSGRVIFVLAIPSTDNKAQIGRRELALIRKDAVFALVSRAHVVDFDALTEALMEAGSEPRSTSFRRSRCLRIIRSAAPLTTCCRPSRQKYRRRLAPDRAHGRGRSGGHGTGVSAIAHAASGTGDRRAVAVTRDDAGTAATRGSVRQATGSGRASRTGRGSTTWTRRCRSSRSPMRRTRRRSPPIVRDDLLEKRRPLFSDNQDENTASHPD